MGKRGQISVEYMMIIAVSLMIIIPASLLFRSFVFESSDKLMKNRINEVSSLILLKANKVHYYGPPSKMLFSVDMPPGIGNMYILNKSNEHYLAFKFLGANGEEELLIESDVPLLPETIIECNFECLDGAECRCFSEHMFSRGTKNFQVRSFKNNNEFFVLLVGDKA
ncbi:MAG: class III signal peptide-containing protein [Candidatus Woesearchaeota archaeon]|nr:class III signal peptide-containing protein [Candidatus Woesearchaeota archaeon]